jgi:hypothetical protein
MKLKSFLATVLLVVNFSIKASELDGAALLEMFGKTIDADRENNPYINRLINQGADSADKKPAQNTGALNLQEQTFLGAIMIECGILPDPYKRKAANRARKRIRKAAQLLNSTDDSGAIQ